MIAQEMKSGVGLHRPMIFSLKASLPAQHKIIDELPRFKHAARMPAFALSSPRNWEKCSTRILVSGRAPMQARILELATAAEE